MSIQRTGWMTNLPLTGKLTLAFGLIFACYVTTAIYVLTTFDRDAELRRQEQQQVQIIQALEKSGQELRMQQLAIRDYLIHGNAEAVDAMELHRRLRDEGLESAKQLAADGRVPEIDNALREAHAWDTGIASLIEAESRISDEVERTRMSREYLARNKVHAEAVLSELNALYSNEVGRFVQARAQMDARIASVRWFTIVMLCITVLLIVGGLLMVARLVASPIRRLSTQMAELADGKLDIEVMDSERKDEVGGIAKALEIFRINAVRIHDDNWVKRNTSEVLAALQSTDSPTAFGETLICEMAQRLSVPVGVFFCWNPERKLLELAGSYGFQHRKHLGLEYALGEGLTGQCARERKRIALENVPEDYFAIHSAIGESRPRHVLAQPLMLRDRLLGVLEFATFDRFTPAQEELIEKVLPAAALGLDNARGFEQTQQLLEQTQRQAEELQHTYDSLRAQEEELRAANDELQSKTVELEEHAQRLAASEEELRVQAEELQASNEELRQKTDTLNQQKDVLESLQRETELKAQELARASQYKSDFLANMSHELRTPLNSLLILSRELADNEHGHLDEDEVEAAQVIHDSGSNLLRLINDILDLSKIEAGKMDVMLAPVEIASITHEIQRHFRHMALDKDLEFSVELGDSVPASLVTDRPKLQQILNNLLGNAFKFTHQGKVSVNVAMASPAILTRIGAPAKAKHLAISVTDTGIGIPEDRLHGIFEAFEQVDASSSRQYGGSGLGLAIALRLAKLLGGDLLVDSQLDAGSTFTLTLPLDLAPDEEQRSALQPLAASPAPSAMSASAAMAALPQQVVPSGWVPDDRHTVAPGEKVILTIEDDIAFARILVDIIRRKGLRALAAPDGESGLELARRFRPTGILLDVMLPGMDGWTVMQYLKQDPSTTAIPVHFISAVDEAERGRAMGAIGYLTKPVDRKSLQAAFDRMLDVAGKIVRKLLVVDKDPESREALVQLVRNEKVEIDEAASGAEALERIEATRYDCIVLDLDLDDMSSNRFLEAASSAHPLPPVVIYSGRELAREESLKLRQYTDSIVIKGERSPERLLDEISLFLHSLGHRPNHVSEARHGDDLAGRTILLVDDDMRNLFALSKALRARGLSVLMAQDGFKALHQLDEHPEIGLVVMDIMMPGMDGYETIREIRKQEQWAKLPIIAVTAKAMPGDRDKCLEAGANDYLAKPVDMDKLTSMMRVWMQA